MIVINTKNTIINNNIKSIILDIPCNYQKVNGSYKIELKDTLCKKSIEFTASDLISNSKLYYGFVIPFNAIGEYEYTVTDVTLNVKANGLLRIESDEAKTIVNHPTEFTKYDNTTEGYITPKLI